MCATSIHTFVRAFNNTPGGIARAAGDYTNTPLAKNTKIFLGLISLGLLYGLAVLIEHFANVRPKIRELAEFNCKIYTDIVECPRRTDSLGIAIDDGKKLWFYQAPEGIFASDNHGNSDQNMHANSFGELLSKIHQDARANPEIYADLVFRSTIGASINLDSPPSSTYGNAQILSEIQLQLYTVIKPKDAEDYKAALRQKFFEITKDVLTEGGESRLPSSMSRNDGMYQSSNFVDHTEIIEYFERFAAAAYPSSNGSTASQPGNN